MLKKLIEIRNNILIGNKLKLVVVAISLLIIALTFVSIRSISKLNNTINQINEGHIKSLVKLSGLVENIYGILIESHIVEERSLNENAIESSVNLDLINTYLTEYEHSINNQTQKGHYDAFLLEFQNYLNILREVNSLTIKGNLKQATQLRTETEYQSYKKLQGIIKSMMTYNVDGINSGYQQISELRKKAYSRIYFVGILVLILSALITSFILKDIRSSVKALTDNLLILNEGQIPETLLQVNKNEIGHMAHLANGLTKNIAELNRFANDISKGNLSSKYELVGQDDLLGKALVNLRNSLIISKEEDEKRKIDDERRNWTNQGHTIFGEILRQRSREVNQLTDDIIKNLVYYLKANQGGLFIINDSFDIPKIELVSAFAYDRKKFFERTINIGDGLIGTVALERNTIYLKEVPEDYIEIESGLGEASPNFLLIVPLKFEDDILGIVELASFKEFLDYEIKFIEEVAQSIASTLLTAKINARTEQLLNESRKQSEELALQEVEARQNIEEMRAAQELAQRREADLGGILSAVDNTLMKGEYELDGTLISVNNRHLQTMGYQLKEIKGKNIEMFVPKDELEHFRKVWANVVAGNPRQLEVRRRTKTGEILWLINQYTPVTDISGRISRILYLAHDITKYKKSEEESFARATAMEFKDEELQKTYSDLNDLKDLLARKEGEFSSILKAVDLSHLLIVIDAEGHIIDINNQALQSFKLAKDEVIGKQFISVFNPDKTNSQFLSLLQSLNSGNPVLQKTKYTLTDKSSLWLDEIYTPVNLPEQELRIQIIARNITQFKELEDLKAKLLEESNRLSEELHQKEKEIQENIGFSKNAEIEPDLTSIENSKTIEAINNALPKIETDLNLKIISVNKKFTELFKFTQNELKNKHINSLVVEKEKNLLDVDPDELKEAEPIEIQLKLQNKSKEVFPVVFKLIPINLKIKEAEKIMIYISGGDIASAQEPDSSNLNNELNQKKIEIEELTKKIESLKSGSNKITTGSEEFNADELYNKWLNDLKAEHFKKD